MLHRSGNILADEPKIHYLWANKCQQNSLWTSKYSENWYKWWKEAEASKHQINFELYVIIFLIPK